MNRILQLLAALVLGLFVGIWVWIGLSILKFVPTTGHPMRDFTTAQITVAGFLASAVAAGTASVLGIEIQKVSGATLAGAVGQAAGSSKLLFAGIAAYALVGTFVLVVWLAKSGTTPDVVGAFATGVLGWLGGAFAAVFRKT